MIVVGVLSCFSKWLKVQITSNNNVLRKKRLKLNPKSKVPNTGHGPSQTRSDSGPTKRGYARTYFTHHIHRVKYNVNFIIMIDACKLDMTHIIWVSSWHKIVRHFQYEVSDWNEFHNNITRLTLTFVNLSRNFIIKKSFCIILMEVRHRTTMLMLVR